MRDSHTETNRARRHTSPEALERIDNAIEANIRYYATQPREAINRRIAELDREWSMERRLITNASTLGLAGAVLGLTVNRKFFMLTAAVMGFLFQHAVKGWCPPVPVMRRLGVRTRGEIDREKYALKALRGDFEGVGSNGHAQAGSFTQTAVQEEIA